MRCLTASALCLTLTGVVSTQTTLPPYHALYASHRWFALREAVGLSDAPALYRGALASAFNRSADAERALLQAIREGVTADVAAEAREMLGTLYMRQGRSADALRVFEEMRANEPGREDLRSIIALLSAVSQRPVQRVTASRRVRFACETGPRGVRLPATVNGTRVRWLIDTGFTTTALSEQTATDLGIGSRDVAMRAVDGVGGALNGLKAAVADRLSIGGVELRDVPLLVFPDAHPMWSGFAPADRGIIGLPVIFAMRAVQWTRGGTCETGALTARERASQSSTPNLAFEGLTPVTRVELNGQPLDFDLDTGNQSGTQLWRRFAREHADLLTAQGTKRIMQRTQIGGAVPLEVTMLPEIRLRIGGLATALRPAPVYAPPVGDDRAHGNLGMDLLAQAETVVIDFDAMTLTLR